MGNEMKELVLLQVCSFIFILTRNNAGSELKPVHGGVGIISALRVGLQYYCTLSCRLPALPLLLSCHWQCDCITEVRHGIWNPDHMT